METLEKICGLCLNLCDNYKAMEGNIRNVVDTVFQKIYLAPVKELVMCTRCTEMLIKCFHFKTACFCTYDYLVPFFNKNRVKLDLKVIYLNKIKNGAGVPEDQYICGFCMSPVRSCLTRSVDVEDGDVILQKMIEQCLPELDLSIIEKPVICASCHESLDNYFRLITNCLTVEEKMKKYCETLDLTRNGQVELSSLLQFTMKDAMSEADGNLADIVKVEKQICDDSENAKGKIDYENMSFMDTNDPKFDNEQQSSLKNLLESNTFEMIKIEEAFYIENESELNEGGNLVGIEDQKFLINDAINIKPDEQDFNSTKYCETDVIKVEKQFCNDSETTIEEIDHPKFDNRQQNSSQNLLTCKEENNKLGMIKIEETFSEESKSELDEENQIGIIEEEIEIKPDEQDFNRFEDGVLSQSEVTPRLCKICLLPNLERDPSFIKQTSTDNNGMKIAMCRCECSLQTKYENPSKVTMYNCDSCSYQAKRKSNLKRHLLVHKSSLEIPMYKCHYCSFQTKYKSHLTRHFFLRHKSSKEATMYTCNACSYQTEHKDLLKSHLQAHKEEKIYKCDFCTYYSKRKNQLNIHLLVHKDPSEVTMYKCDACSYETKHKCHLTRHFLFQHKDSS